MECIFRLLYSFFARPPTEGDSSQVDKYLSNLMSRRLNFIANINSGKPHFRLDSSLTTLTMMSKSENMFWLE